MILFETIVRDFRYGFRMLYRNLGFTLVAIVALAVGIGVNTAVFTAYKALVARPVDARDAGKIYNIALIRNSGNIDYKFSYPDYEDYRDMMHSFSGLILFHPEQLRLSGRATNRPVSELEKLGLAASSGSNANFVSVFAVSENYFKVLGVTTVRGRTFDAVGPSGLLESPAVLISENFWRKQFGADPGIIGSVVKLNGVEVTIMGITPLDFIGTGVAVPDLWMPVSLDPLVHADADRLNNRESQQYRLFGRLAPDASVEQAKSEMTILTNRFRILHDPSSESAKPSAALIWPGSPFPAPLSSYKGLGLTIALIMVATAMVLIVACANVGSLQLARARARQGELSTRMSLGASRFRIIRQLLTESALLGVFAGIVGLLLAWACLKLLVILIAGALPAESGTLIVHVAPDLVIFAYSLGISVFAGILFGLAPAMESSRSALTSTVRGSTSVLSARRLQDFFIAAQVSLSLVLMIAGSMLIRTSLHSIRTDAGYESAQAIDLDIQFPEGPKYSASRRLALIRELRERLVTVPGVAAITSARPPDDNTFLTPVALLDSSYEMAGKKKSLLYYKHIQPNYFETLSIPLSEGRSFRADMQSEKSIILSESAAKLLFPSQNPIGRSVRVGTTDEQFHNWNELLPDGPIYQVVGIARDTRGVEFDGSDSKQIYLPFPDDQLQSYPLIIRTLSQPRQVLKGIDSIVSSVDPDLVSTSSTLREMLRRSAPFIVSTLAAAISSSLGTLGLLLALMGIYSTVSYIVVLRTREIGVRMAIGAQKYSILSLILRDSSRPVVAGLFFGGAVAYGASYVLRGLLYGLKNVDVISIVSVSLLFLISAMVASYPPARRAMAVDPVQALRYE